MSLGVLAAYRGRGVGGTLLDSLMTGLPTDRALLGTEDDYSPAVALYRSRGWLRLGPLAPGVQVMGWRAAA